MRHISVYLESYLSVIEAALTEDRAVVNVLQIALQHVSMGHFVSEHFACRLQRKHTERNKIKKTSFDILFVFIVQFMA